MNSYVNVVFFPRVSDRESSNSRSSLNLDITRQFRSIENKFLASNCIISDYNLNLTAFLCFVLCSDFLIIIQSSPFQCWMTFWRKLAIKCRDCRLANSSGIEAGLGQKFVWFLINGDWNVLFLGFSNQTISTFIISTHKLCHKADWASSAK